MSDQQQWTPVPPPNPYATQAPRKQGLALTAMVLGLVAILTTAVSALYFNAFVAAGVILGILAIVFGIIALATRQGLTGGSVTGLVTGALSLVLAIAMVAFSLVALVAPDGPSSQSGEGMPEPWDPDAPSEQLLEWPANMGTGGLVFGPGAELARSSSLESGDTPETLEVARNGGDAAAPNDVLIYVDYRCPHCASFEQLNGELLGEALETGEIVLEVKPLAFVDPQRSAQASAAMACIANDQPEVAWLAHEALLGPIAHSGQGDGSLDALAGLLDDAVGGLNPATSDCILTERFVPFAEALSEWALANPAPNAVDAPLTVTGTPTVLVNGVAYPGSPEDAAAFRAFFEEQIR